MVIGVTERAVLLPWVQIPHLSLFLTATDEDGPEAEKGLWATRSHVLPREIFTRTSIEPI